MSAKEAEALEQTEEMGLPKIIGAIAEDMEQDNAEQMKQVRLKYESIIKDLYKQLESSESEGHYIRMIVDGSIVAHLRAAERTIKKVGKRIQHPDRELIISMLQSMETELTNA